MLLDKKVCKNTRWYCHRLNRSLQYNDTDKNKYILDFFTSTGVYSKTSDIGVSI